MALQGEVRGFLLEKREGMWAGSGHRYSLDTKQTPKVHMYMRTHMHTHACNVCTLMHAHTHTHELQRSANQAHTGEVNMTAKSHFIELMLKSPSPGPSSVEKRPHRQKERKPVGHPAHFLAKGGCSGKEGMRTTIPGPNLRAIRLVLGA